MKHKTFNHEDGGNAQMLYDPSLGANGMFVLMFDSYEKAEFFAEGLLDEIRKAKKHKMKVDEYGLVSFEPDRPLPSKQAWRWRKGVRMYAVVSDGFEG